MGPHVVPASEEEAEALHGTLSLGAWRRHRDGQQRCRPGHAAQWGGDALVHQCMR
jgi:hypothetical protein